MNEKKFSEAMSEVNDRYYEEAAQYERKQKKPAWTKWAAMVACLCLVVIAGIIVPKLANPAPVESSTQFTADIAPMVYVNDTLYRITGNQPDITGKDSRLVYLGTISSNVSSSQYPQENFQANDDIVGSAVYQFGEDIAVEINGQYWLYENYTDVVIVP